VSEHARAQAVSGAFHRAWARRVKSRYLAASLQRTARSPTRTSASSESTAAAARPRGRKANPLTTRHARITTQFSKRHLVASVGRCPRAKKQVRKLTTGMPAEAAPCMRCRSVVATAAATLKYSVAHTSIGCAPWLPPIHAHHLLRTPAELPETWTVRSRTDYRASIVQAPHQCRACACADRRTIPAVPCSLHGP